VHLHQVSRACGLERPDGCSDRLANVVWSKGSWPVTANLTDLIRHQNLDNDIVFLKAMHVIEGLRTEPTCHQAAAAQLLMTCKAVGKDGSNKDNKDELLDRVKSIYGARVAICENAAGKAAVPIACSGVFTISSIPADHFDVVSGHELSKCLESLRAEQPFWTSYSNKMQDAGHLCRGATLETTKQEMLRTYQRLAEFLPEFTEALHQSHAQWQALLRQQQAQAQVVHESHRQKMEDMMVAYSAAQQEFVGHAQSLYQSIKEAAVGATTTREVRSFLNSELLAN